MRIEWPPAPRVDEPGPEVSAADEQLAREMLGGWATGWFVVDLDDGTPLEWRTVDVRAIIRPSESLVQSVRRSVRANRMKFVVRFDTDFETILHHCSRPGRRSWLTGRLQGAYRALRAAGVARSVAVYDVAGELVGGALNVTVGGAAFSDSSYYHASGAGVAAQIGILELHVREGRSLVDLGYLDNDHLRRFGAVEIEREVYMAELHAALTPPEPRVVHVPKRLREQSA